MSRAVLERRLHIVDVLCQEAVGVMMSCEVRRNGVTRRYELALKVWLALNTVRERLEDQLAALRGLERRAGRRLSA